MIDDHDLVGAQNPGRDDEGPDRVVVDHGADIPDHVDVGVGQAQHPHDAGQRGSAQVTIAIFGAGGFPRSATRPAARWSPSATARLLRPDRHRAPHRRRLGQPLPGDDPALHRPPVRRAQAGPLTGDPPRPAGGSGRGGGRSGGVDLQGGQLTRGPAGVGGDGDPDEPAGAGGNGDRHRVARRRVEPVARRPASVLNVAPSVLPGSDSVWLRAAQAAAGGSLSTSRPTVWAEPRSTCAHCGKALLALSQ